MKSPLDIARLEFYVYQLPYHLTDVGALNTVRHTKQRLTALSIILAHGGGRPFFDRHRELACGLRLSSKSRRRTVLLRWLPDRGRSVLLHLLRHWFLLSLDSGTILLRLAEDLTQLLVRLGVFAYRLQPLTKHHLRIKYDTNYILLQWICLDVDHALLAFFTRRRQVHLGLEQIDGLFGVSVADRVLITESAVFYLGDSSHPLAFAF